MNATRREFLEKIALVAGVAATMPLAIVACGDSTSPGAGGNPDFTIDVSSMAVGASVVTSEKASNGAPAIVSRKADAEFVAFSMKCTHQGCTVGAPAATKVMTCPCHGSQFNATTGDIVNGPASSPLAKLKTTYDQTAKTLRIQS